MMMTLATATAFSPIAPSLWDRLSALRADVSRWAVQRQAYRTALAELDALSDRDLSDLGLARAEIARVALEAAQA